MRSAQGSPAANDAGSLDAYTHNVTNKIGILKLMVLIGPAIETLRMLGLGMYLDRIPNVELGSLPRLLSIVCT